MHAVKATRLEPGVSARALMDEVTLAQMSRRAEPSLSFDMALSPRIHLETGQAPELTGTAVAYACSHCWGDCSTHMMRPSVTPARASSEFSKGIPERGLVRTGNLHIYIHPQLETKVSYPLRSRLLSCLLHVCRPT